MLSKLLRFGRRQLHTVVSREIIKPSSPTPSHSKIYNLSVFDQILLDSRTPIVAFYPNLDQNSYDKIHHLKNSLSKTLSQYYPFAGRVKKTSPTYVDCNDEGVEFIEASNDSSLSDFLQQSEHEDLDPLFPNDLIWFDRDTRGDPEGVTCPLAVQNTRGDPEGVTCPLAVQVNRFACGGVAVASTLFHKVADARTMLNFINHWASVAAKKDTSLINPNIIPFQARNYNLPEILGHRSRVGCVTRSFLFSNQKLNDLKAKVTAMTMETEQPIMNPTRVEVLSWLLHRRAMAAAAKKNSGTFKANGMLLPMDMRGILTEKLPGTSIGNLAFVIEVPPLNESELAPHIFIGEMRKRKATFQHIPNFDTATYVCAQMSSETILETSKRTADYYIYSSLCRFPTYDFDFGWGKPVKVTVGGTIKNLTILMATPDDNGIEALMCLEKEDMKILQNDPELLAFC